MSEILFIVRYLWYDDKNMIYCVRRDTMREIVPDYYPHFQCIADQCRHSCCIGWEIDVDDESLAKYRTLPGTLGEELRTVIAEDTNCAHFRLTEEERCPFLNSNGLCRLILDLGEDSLCQICRDHPRFRNEFSNCTEIGLGMCCEAAAHLILTQKRPLKLISLSDDGADDLVDEQEQWLLSLREQLFGLLYDENWSLEERLENILDLCGIDLPEKTDAEWVAVYRDLERLDSTWDAILDTLTLPPQPISSEWDLPFAQLAAYFLFRHIPRALEDGAPAAHAAFAVLSTRIVRRLFAASSEQTLETLVELCRQYSSEIEYSPENTNILLDLCCGIC